MFKLCFIAISSLLVSTTIQAQNIEAVPERTISKQVIENQMNQILVTSSNYKDLKMVPTTSLENLRSDVMTLLSRNENDLTNSKSVLESKNSEIKNLRDEINEAKTQIAASETHSDTFLLFGMETSKTMYHAIMWSFVLTLLITVIFLTVRFKRANEITQNSKTILSEVEDEFETFKRHAIEREQKLRRQLQDEINKQKKLADAS